ncbi:SGNH/GDSL hydrolase family protein [Subtercola sp. YIM 133946]|uniref:SGNH/GDSL hydrolase family protein n=1 Tax=Subtercola sp. YIM 133946 TaxID=3118909 RepID=UPI002F9262ED
MNARRRRSLAAPLAAAGLTLLGLTLWGGQAAYSAPNAAPSSPLSTAATSTAAPADLAGKHYVALGDSYSAGFGLQPFSDSPAAGCYQADENYPHLAAAALGLDLTDVTCSGAVTANIIDTPQVTIGDQGTAPVQSLALTDQTDVVTVTIGGNDLGFADVAQSCVALDPAGPTFTGFDTCKERYDPDGFDLLADKIHSTVSPALDNTFALIRQKAPNAKVIVVGYPTISPDVENTPAAGCFSDPLGTGEPPFPANTFPFTATDTQYLHSVEAKLDTAIRVAAEANGAGYISTLPLTENHSACAPAADAYINGISLIPAGSAPGTPTPLSNIDVALGALHPNAAGVAFLDAQVVEAITAAFQQPGQPDPTATPTPTPLPSSSASGSPSAAPAGTAGSANADSSSAKLAETGQTDVVALAATAAALVLAGGGAAGLVVGQRRRSAHRSSSGR